MTFWISKFKRNYDHKLYLFVCQWNNRIEDIWLILPELMCLFQRLSHACISLIVYTRNRERLIIMAMIYLILTILNGQLWKS
jgi:hypothetical protein